MQTFKLGLIISLFFTLIYILFSDFLLRIFTDIPEIIEGAKSYLIWIIIIPVISFSAFLWDGIFIGITDSKGLRNSMLLSTIVFFSIYYFVRTDLANDGLWLSFTIFLGVRGLAQTFIYQFKILKRN